MLRSMIKNRVFGEIEGNVMKVKDVLPFLKENESDFKVHCGRGSTDTFLPLRLFLQDQ